MGKLEENFEQDVEAAIDLLRDIVVNHPSVENIFEEYGPMGFVAVLGDLAAALLNGNVGVCIQIANETGESKYLDTARNAIAEDYKELMAKMEAAE